MTPLFFKERGGHAYGVDGVSQIHFTAKPQGIQGALSSLAVKQIMPNYTIKKGASIEIKPRFIQYPMKTKSQIYSSYI